ncbi:unnamed protein product [Thlaspi arvense]|uniref:NB-ARC domain-containing protein n=1 Tax=Thlaspi arvense TaxID=13288 RepID=A0AAU9RRG3_THLAR|nr:unnamed protein product [Thlaspi arvense]
MFRLGTLANKFSVRCNVPTNFGDRKQSHTLYQRFRSGQRLTDPVRHDRCRSKFLRPVSASRRRPPSDLPVEEALAPPLDRRLQLRKEQHGISPSLKKMGIPCSISCDQRVDKISQWLGEKVAYIHDLKKNLVALKETMDELKAKRGDLLRRINREEDRGRQRLSVFQVWLTKTETVEREVNGLLSARDDELQKLCLCKFCSKSLISSYRYGRSVVLKLREVENLNNKEFKEISEPSLTSEVEEMPLQPIIVGQERMLEKAWKHLKEDGVGMMGLYGMGGVGKTTLLTQINNKFSEERCGFDFVIWVVVSQELHEEKIQDEIAQKVGLGGEEWNQKDKSQKTNVLYKFLKKKKFVLFLDDLWQKVDLTDIGVPDPTRGKNRCKVAFTTRSQEVCAHMGVQDPMEVQCLADNEAFDLFQKKVGERTLGSHPEIPDLARIVARKCDGLPLALNVIGETMSCKRTVQEWQHAIDVLTEYAIEFSGMEDKILLLLKYSYDNLKGEQVKSCLLYCALFPEDDEIDKEELIGYWIGEGIIDASEGIERAENKGYEIIGSLVRASLLMEVEWSVGLRKIPKVKNWNVVRRMSLMKNKIHRLAGSPECLGLKTLLFQYNKSLEKISSEFFKSMPKLLVLDLSHNRELSEVPEGISQLVSLQYLDLSWTNIRHLPKGLQELKKLIHLNLMFTEQLRSIAGISRLHNLKVLKLSSSGFSWDLSTVEELESLEHLQVLMASFHCPPQVLKQFLSSHKLTSCTRSLEMGGKESSGLLSIPVTMEKLRRLNIYKGTFSEIKMVNICIKSKTVSPLHNPSNVCFSSLSKVLIWACKRLRELTWLMFSPNLRYLDVRDAEELKDIIKKERVCEGEESGIVPFPKLVSLTLDNLPMLKNIYCRPLPLPCLEEINVTKCPNLKKVPLDSQSGENGLIINYREKEWIEGVEWEDEATRTRFLSSCQEI